MAQEIHHYTVCNPNILADITKTLSGKRKRLEQYTQNSLKISNRKVEDIWRVQQKERYALNWLQLHKCYLPDFEAKT